MRFVMVERYCNLLERQSEFQVGTLEWYALKAQMVEMWTKMSREDQKSVLNARAGEVAVEQLTLIDLR